ncbi:MAG: hypothetical protein MHM6MM_004308 [Cercozoa sp. M6MM]
MGPIAQGTLVFFILAVVLGFVNFGTTAIGANKRFGLYCVMISMAVFSCYIVWLMTYMHQMNPMVQCQLCVLCMLNGYAQVEPIRHMEH